MALLGHTEIEDELLRQNVLKTISIHRVHFSDKLIARINIHSKNMDIGDLKEVTDKVCIILQEYVLPISCCFDTFRCLLHKLYYICYIIILTFKVLE